jgi:putative ABC transport system substrate-binding protein
MERRQFIRALCSGVVAWPLAAYAQQVSNPRRIGVLGADATVWRPWTSVFAARLRELGWLEGETIAIDYRWAEGFITPIAALAG